MVVSTKEKPLEKNNYTNSKTSTVDPQWTLYRTLLIMPKHLETFCVVVLFDVGTNKQPNDLDNIDIPGGKNMRHTCTCFCTHQIPGLL